MTHDEIQRGLQANLEALESIVDEIRAAGRDAAIKEATYKVEYAKSRLTVKATAMEKLTVSDIEAEATIQCEQVYLEHLIAQNHFTSVREALRAIQSKMDGFRTLSVSYRAAGG